MSARMMNTPALAPTPMPASVAVERPPDGAELAGRRLAGLDALDVVMAVYVERPELEIGVTVLLPEELVAL